MQGKIICFAGLDGSGKTTQARLTSAWMKQQHLANEFLRFHTEPTKAESTEINAKARAYIADQGLMLSLSEIGFIKEAFHIEMKLQDKILPDRALGKHIVLDRYIETFDAYHSIMQKNKNWVRAINPTIPTPDLYFFLDVQPEICFARLQNSGRRLGDHETIETLAKARAFYQSHKNEYSFIILDGAAPADELNHQIRSIIMNSI